MPMTIRQAKTFFIKNKEEIQSPLKVLDGDVSWPIWVKYVGCVNADRITVYYYSLPNRIFTGGWHEVDQQLPEDEIIHFILKPPKLEAHRLEGLTSIDGRP